MLADVWHKSGTEAIDSLNMPFAIEKHISISTPSGKINKWLLWQKAMRIKQDLPPYNASIYLCTESSESERRRVPNKKKIRAANSVRIAIDAGNFDAPLRHRLHCIP